MIIKSSDGAVKFSLFKSKASSIGIYIKGFPLALCHDSNGLLLVFSCYYVNNSTGSIGAKLGGHGSLYDFDLLHIVHIDLREVYIATESSYYGNSIYQDLYIFSAYSLDFETITKYWI